MCWIDDVYRGRTSVTRAYGHGYNVKVEVEDCFFADNRLYHFDHWSDGVYDNPRISTMPNSETVWTAIYWWEPTKK